MKETKSAMKCSDCGKFSSHLAKSCGACGSKKIKKGEYPKEEVNANWGGKKASRIPSGELSQAVNETRLDGLTPAPQGMGANAIEAELIARYISAGDYEKAERVISALKKNAGDK